MEVSIIQPGALTTVQDLGRSGYRHIGVPPGGAVDQLSLRLANMVLGNAENAAGLECTLTGPRLKFSQTSVIAVAGATVDGIEPLRPIRVAAGEPLSLERITRGCRAYLAVAGGFSVPAILGGRGTELRTGFGGWHGRAIKRGDVLPVADARARAPRECRIGGHIFGFGSERPFRIVRGRHWDDSASGLCGLRCSVSSHSNRMGIRLDGVILACQEPTAGLSFAVTPGAIQVPSDGRPIVLLADAQTIGGYPVVAHVISADLHRVAQLRPGDPLRFAEVTMEEARAAAVEQARLLSILRCGISGAIRMSQ